MLSPRFVAAVTLQETTHQLSLGIDPKIAIEVFNVVLGRVNRDIQIAGNLLSTMT